MAWLLQTGEGLCSCRAWPVEALHATADGLSGRRRAVDEQALLQSSLLSVQQGQEGLCSLRDGNG